MDIQKHKAGNRIEQVQSGSCGRLWIRADVDLPSGLITTGTS